MMIRYFLLFSLLFILFNVSAQTDSSDVLVKGEKRFIMTKNNALADSVLDYAKSFVGCRYGYGSCGPHTFDCSGFVMKVYGKYGIELPHGSDSQAALCKEINLKKVKPGDLLFFAGRKVSKKHIGHVAIVNEVQDDKIFMIHSTVQSGVIVEELDKSEYFKKRFIKAGRIEM